MSGSVMLVTDPARIEEIGFEIMELSDQAMVAWDTETSGVNLHNGDVGFGISLCYGEPHEDHSEPVYIPFAHRRGLNAPRASVARLVSALQFTRATHIVHNCQFDWTVLHHAFDYNPAAARCIDTVILAWLSDENATKKLKVLGDIYLSGVDSSKEQRALKALMAGPKYLDSYRAIRLAQPEIPVNSAKLMAKSTSRRRGWGDLTAEEIAEYAAKDAYITLHLYRDVFGGASPGEHNPDHEREMRLCRLLWRMRMQGIALDSQGLRNARAVYQEQADAIQVEFPGVQLGSAKQVGSLLYEDLGLKVLGLTKTGNPSAGKDALEQHEGNPHVEMILDWRRLNKAVTAYCNPLIEWTDGGHGVIHPEFNSTGTVTGRLSCSKPNLMQIPRGDTLPGVRAAFRPRAGMELWEFDLAQAELRVAASISCDENLTSALLEGRDLHTETALAMFGRADGRWRVLAKNINFGILYGAGPKKVAVFLAKVGLTPSDALQKAYEALAIHKAMFPRLHRVSKYMSQMAELQGKLPLAPVGRFRHFKTPGQIIPYHKAFNALIQGGVAEFVKDVMLEADPLHPGMLLQVHDALVYEIAPGEHTGVLSLLSEVADRVNPFKLPMTWEEKQWN